MLASGREDKETQTDPEDLHLLQHQLLCQQVVPGQDDDLLDRSPVCSNTRRHEASTTAT